MSFRCLVPHPIPLPRQSNTELIDSFLFIYKFLEDAWTPVSTFIEVSSSAISRRQHSFPCRQREIQEEIPGPVADSGRHRPTNAGINLSKYQSIETRFSWYACSHLVWIISFSFLLSSLHSYTELPYGERRISQTIQFNIFHKEASVEPVPSFQNFMDGSRKEGFPFCRVNLHTEHSSNTAPFANGHDRRPLGGFNLVNSRRVEPQPSINADAVVFSSDFDVVGIWGTVVSDSTDRTDLVLILWHKEKAFFVATGWWCDTSLYGPRVVWRVYDTRTESRIGQHRSASRGSVPW